MGKPSFISWQIQETNYLFELFRYQSFILSLRTKILKYKLLGDAVKDGILYGELLEQIGPAGSGQRILKETDPVARANAIVAAVNEITPFKMLDAKRIYCIVFSSWRLFFDRLRYFKRKL